MDIGELRDAIMGLFIGMIGHVFPLARVGFLILPPGLNRAFVAAKWLADLHTPVLEQRVLARFMACGDFKRHVRRVTTRNARLREALLAALEDELGEGATWRDTQAGAHLTVWLRGFQPDQGDELVARASAAGVGIYPVTQCFLGTPPGLGLLMGTRP